MFRTTAIDPVEKLKVGSMLFTSAMSPIEQGNSTLKFENENIPEFFSSGLIPDLQPRYEVN